MTIYCASISFGESEPVSVMEPNGSLNGFSGRLENFPLLDVIQMACVARRDGRLEVKHKSEAGRVLLKKGQIVHVETNRLAGEEALLEILCWKTGRFVFSTMLGGVTKRNIQGSWEHVLMEAVRKRDEILGAERVVAREPPEGLRPELASHLLGEIGKQRSRTVLLRRILQGVGVLLASLAIAGGAVLVKQFGGQILSKVDGLVELGSRGLSKKKNYQVQIPEGAFIYQDGETRRLGTYNIDATEVTVWQYADFLKAIGARTDFDYPGRAPRSCCPWSLQSTVQPRGW